VSRSAWAAKLGRSLKTKLNHIIGRHDPFYIERNQITSTVCSFRLVKQWTEGPSSRAVPTFPHEDQLIGRATPLNLLD